MLIYGTKSTQLTKEVLPERCGNCDTYQSIEMIVFQKYAHVFWIPFLPLGKTVITQCHHCKQVMKQKEMPPAFTAAYDNLKAQVKTPIWTFSGIALLVILITAAFVSNKQDKAENAVLILDPKSGDVFEVKTEDNQYTLYMVENVEGDSALIRINEYETNKMSGLADLKRKGNNVYSPDVYAFSKSELKAMLDKGEIIDIERK